MAIKQLPQPVIDFLENQGYVIVATLDHNGIPHASCKGIVEIKPDGHVYLLDLYSDRTLDNLKRNPRISITAVDEHRFMGFCLKGRAKAVNVDKLSPRVGLAWEEKINTRITRRILKNMREEKGHPHYPEALLPKPEYMLVMKVTEIVDLSPSHIAQKKRR